MIPVKIVIDGDIPRGKLFIGMAKGQMQRLRRSMSFQKLREGFNTTTPFPGVVVQCWRSHSLEVINIYVEPVGGAGGVAQPKPEQWKECLCVPHFSFGIVILVTPEKPADDADPEDIAAYNEFLLGGERFTYSINLCNTRRYILYENVYSAGWEKYNVGQYVLVSMGNDDPIGSYDCERRCLLQEPEFEVFIVSPLHALGKMKKWQYWTK